MSAPSASDSAVNEMKEEMEDTTVYQQLPDAVPRPQPNDTASVVTAAAATRTNMDVDNIPLTGGDSVADAGNCVPLLKQYWINEKSSPELLFYEADLIEQVQTGVEARQAELNEQIRKPDSFKYTVLYSLLQMEVDRINFMVHAYHRCRLKKLEKFAAFIHHHPDELQKCSEHEKAFVNGYYQLIEAHLQHSFFSELPNGMRSWIPLNRADGTVKPEHRSLLVQPDSENSFVTFRVKASIDNYSLGVDENEVIPLHEGEILVGSWHDFKELFSQGLIELI